MTRAAHTNLELTLHALLVLRTVLLLSSLVALDRLDELLLHQAGLWEQENQDSLHERRYCSTHLLLPNLTVTSTAALLLQCLYPTLEDIAERTGVRNEVLELLRVSLGRSLVRVVERAAVEVRYPRDVVVVRPEVVLDRRNLRDAGRSGAEARAIRLVGRTSL